MRYAESYHILGSTWGIEDYEDGRPAKEHFCANATHKRYRLWRGGGGFGQADTLADARKQLIAFAHQLTSQRLADAQTTAEACSRTLKSLEAGEDGLSLLSPLSNMEDA